MVALLFGGNMEKLKRKKLDKQERQMPTNIEQLIKYYSLEHVWTYIDKIIDKINEIERGG